MLKQGYPFSFFHQQGAVTLMLKLDGISAVHWNHRPIDMKLTYYTCGTL